MTYRIIVRLPKFTKKSLEYKLIKQAVTISKRVPPFLQVLKEEVQAVSALCHPLIQGLGKRKLS